MRVDKKAKKRRRGVLEVCGTKVQISANKESLVLPKAMKLD